MGKALFITLLVGCGAAPVMELDDNGDDSAMDYVETEGDAGEVYDDAGEGQKPSSNGISIGRVWYFADETAIDAGADSGFDAESDSGDELPVETETDAQVEEDAETDSEVIDCRCFTDDQCCDGCDPINIGELCNDDLVCTAETKCLGDGTCGAGVPACVAPNPECQAAACDESTGCVISSIREGERCSDKNEHTYDDKCVDGDCIGTPCECSTGSCCDGCHVRPENTQCSDTIVDGYSCSCPKTLWQYVHYYRCDGSADGCTKLTSSSVRYADCGSDEYCSIAFTSCMPGPNDACH